MLIEGLAFRSSAGPVNNALHAMFLSTLDITMPSVMVGMDQKVSSVAALDDAFVEQTSESLALDAFPVVVWCVAFAPVVENVALAAEVARQRHLLPLSIVRLQHICNPCRNIVEIFYIQQMLEKLHVEKIAERLEIEQVLIDPPGPSTSRMN